MNNITDNRELAQRLTLSQWIRLIMTYLIAVIRTALEDRTLQEELPGYREYSQRVRYRLFPGIF
jgi:protein-S-isoprenylcysteine O-methyltransferase Ste14